MIMETVCVLLSTYNGEKYLREQLDSLLSQKGVQLYIYSRDDGSSDSTLDVLEEYRKRDTRIEYFVGENVGPARSFLELMKKAPSADYYALCDQDDVWDDDKLIMAIDMLEQYENDVPNMYFSNLRIVDQSLIFYRMSHTKPRVLGNKYSSLVQPVATGCTMVFNRTACELATRKIPEKVSMHDTWIYMVCRFFGNCVYDEKAHISYRQHENNVIGAKLKRSKWETLKKQIKRLGNHNLQPRYYNAIAFYNLYNDILSDQDAQKVRKLVDYKKSIRHQLQLMFDTEIKGPTRISDLRYRLLIALRNV